MQPRHGFPDLPRPLLPKGLSCFTRRDGASLDTRQEGVKAVMLVGNVRKEDANHSSMRLDNSYSCAN